MSTFGSIWSGGCVYFLKYKFLAMCSQCAAISSGCANAVYLLYFAFTTNRNQSATKQLNMSRILASHVIICCYVACIQFAHCITIGMCSHFRVQNRSVYSISFHICVRNWKAVQFVDTKTHKCIHFVHFSKLGHMIFTPREFFGFAFEFLLFCFVLA